MNEQTIQIQELISGVGKIVCDSASRANICCRWEALCA